jgi:hypothetical protein
MQHRPEKQGFGAAETPAGRQQPQSLVHGAANDRIFWGLAHIEAAKMSMVMSMHMPLPAGATP